MESYEEFCLRSLARLQSEGEGSGTGRGAPAPLQALSLFRFHGRTVLSPLLSEEQRREMVDYRQRAAQLEVGRQTLCRNSLLAGVQDILDNTQSHTVLQVHRVPEMEIETQPPTPPYCRSPKPETLNGYTLVTDSPGLPRGDGIGVRLRDRPTTPHTEPLTLLNGYGGEGGAWEEDRREEIGDRQDASLESLLRRSREFIEREHGQRGSKGVSRATPTPSPVESLSDKENERRSPLGETSTEQGYRLRHSPLSSPQIQYRNQAQAQTQYQYQAQAQFQAVCDLYDPRSGCLSPGLPDPYTRLPSPEPSQSPRPHRRRPRPVSAGNILISFPIGPADLIPRGLGRSGESVAMAAWGETASEGVRSPDHGSVAGSGGGSDSRRANHFITSPVREISNPISMTGHGPLGHEVITSGFRRRCHTMDSQLHPAHSSTAPGAAIDRSQERLPRFMGGVPRLAPCRRTPAGPLNQSYEVENPSPSLLRPHVAPDLSPCHVKLRREIEGPHGLHEGHLVPTVFSNPREEQDNNTEAQRHVQALEDMQRRMEDEHDLQMSLLMAEQEREQQRLRQELEEKERRLREQGCGRPLSGDIGGRDRRAVSDSYPALSPSCPGLSPAHSPADRSHGHSIHSIGLPSPLSSNVSSPSIQPPVYLWGPIWGGSKPRGRLSQVMTPEQQRALCRLGAITHGFLTRRLLKTEKVKHLRQTVQDTHEFIRSFQTEAPQKTGSISAQDSSLQERVRAQLRAALYDVHDIFFEMPLEERLALLQQDRELRAERKLREMEKARSPKDRVALSAATQRSLDRKKRMGESPSQARKVQQKPKSPPANRILKPSQGQNAPVPGQLNRQGSWYRKTPEERVRRSDSLKKQHSLG